MTPPPASAAVPPADNPPIEQSCGLDLTLVLDASGSVESSHAVDDVRDAGDALLTALTNTNSTARVTQFASLSEVLAPRTLVDDASMGDGGALAEALQGYFSPKPQRPSNVNIYSYDGSGSPTSSSNFNLANNSIQYTNWDQGLDQAGGENAELMVFVTDGDPTGFDLDRPTDPFDHGPPPDVAVNTNRGDANQVTMDRAVEEANAIKGDDTRILAVGVGSALNNSASRGRLVQIAGPQVVDDADLGNVDDLNDIDVALVTDFEDLAAFMRGLVLQLCSPSLTVRKLAQTPGNAEYTPEQGRDITVTPTVPGGDFSWILPDTNPAVSKTVPTDANGFSQFQWEPDPPEADSTATVTEATDPDLIPGRPDGDDFTCTLRDEFGNVRTVAGDFTDPSNPSFELDPIGQEVVTCTIYNSYDYQPDIELAKVNAPTEVRGDLVPPAEVTSSYVVTNPGNTPLANVTITDNRCGPVEPVLSGGDNVGDTNGDGLLDPGEEWEYTCTQPVLLGRSTAPGGRNFVNNAEVSATDPTSEQVTATADDDVDVFTPAITLEKTVNGVEVATIEQGDTVTYSYEVTNVGNTPLGTVDLDDDTPPCLEPTLDDDGNGDAVLDVGETWVYVCQATPAADVVNTADVSAIPLNPLDGNAEFADPNPPVTDEDPAQVVVVNANIHLTKSVTPEDVLLQPGANPPAEAVDYTFVAENTGTAPLGRPGGGSPTAPGWISDNRCDQPATYVEGDADGDDLLDPGETWTFTCPGSVTQPTVNVARITGQPTDADGEPLPIPAVTDRAVAFVDVHQPAIHVTKTALVPKVLDPDATPVAGPDTPTPRPAEYRYEVANPGDVPLDLSPDPPVDDKCEPLQFVEGDTDGSGFLDPAEVWVYTCTTTLEREDADDPPGDRTAQVDNTVTVSGIPQLDGTPRPDRTVNGDASASVEVIEPGLQLTKTVSDGVVKFGSDVVYTVAVENTGDTELDLVGPEDDKCAPLVFEGGDTDGDGQLDGANTTAETWTWTCTRAIAPEDSDVDTNTASVTGVDPLGNSYVDEDSVDVRVVRPAIEVTKVPDLTLVPVGTEVTYDFEVRNVGLSVEPTEDALEEVFLLDLARPPVPGCRLPVLVAKEGGNQDDILEREPAEVWRYRCSAPISRPTLDLALVDAIGGRPVGLEFHVEDWDVAFVRPFSPGIDVVKTAQPTRIEGSGKVTYTYVVTNTGDVPLAGVAEGITDDTCSPVKYVRGDLDKDGLLDTADSIFEDAVDETWIFQCTTVIDETTTNVVTAPGIPTDAEGEVLCGPESQDGRVKVPCDVSARDRAIVHVVADIGPDDEGDGDDGGPPGTGDLGDTGAPPWMVELLLLALLLVVTGLGLLIATRRRPTTE